MSNRRVPKLTDGALAAIPSVVGEGVVKGDWRYKPGKAREDTFRGFKRRGDIFNATRAVEANVADHMRAAKGTLGLGGRGNRKGVFGPYGPDGGMENRVITALDDKMMLEEMMSDKTMLAELVEEHLPIHKRLRGEKNADRILSEYQSLAAKTLVRSMLFGAGAESRQGAKDILDRVLGKPIERKMTMALNVDAMTVAEVDNELKRLTSGDAGGQEAKIIEAAFTEGEVVEGNEVGAVSTEPDTEEIHGESRTD